MLLPLPANPVSPGASAPRPPGRAVAAVSPASATRDVVRGPWERAAPAAASVGPLPRGAAAFAWVAATGEPELLTLGGRLDVYA